MECSAIVFSSHAVQRMFARGIAERDVVRVIQTGEIIASYPDDTPYPSALVLGFILSKPLHVVVARQEDTGRCVVISVYVPDPALWEPDFRTRRPKP